jgi:hypothetical protein
MGLAIRFKKQTRATHIRTGWLHHHSTLQPISTPSAQDRRPTPLTVNDIRVLLQSRIPVGIRILCAVRLPEGTIVGSELFGSEILLGLWVGVGDHGEDGV